MKALHQLLQRQLLQVPRLLYWPTVLTFSAALGLVLTVAAGLVAFVIVYLVHLLR